jgi:predicted DNA-binding transcriptional regulator AlpA
MSPATPDAPARYLTLAEVSGITHLSKSTIRRLVKAGAGPSVCRISPKLHRWSESAVHEFMRARMEA